MKSCTNVTELSTMLKCVDESYYTWFYGSEMIPYLVKWKHFVLINDVLICLCVCDRFFLDNKPKNISLTLYDRGYNPWMSIQKTKVLISLWH